MRETYVRSDPVRSLVHDAREEEERRGGLVLLVVALNPLLQCLVHCPGQEYLTSLSGAYDIRCRQRSSKRQETHKVHGLQLDAARPRPSRADALLLRVLEEAPGVHRALGEHDRRRVHEHVLHGVVELRPMEAAGRAGLDALEGGRVRVAGVRGGVRVGGHERVEAGGDVCDGRGDRAVVPKVARSEHFDHRERHGGQMSGLELDR